MHFLAKKDNCLCNKTENKRFIHVKPRTYMQIHTPTVVQGGWMEPPPLEFLTCCSISKRFYLQRKAFNGGTAGGGGGCDVINNGRYFGRHLGFYQELEIRLKKARNGDFFVLEMKNNT